MMKQLNLFLSACLVLSLGIILVYHFYLLWTAGSVLISEPSRAMLVFEILVGIAILLYGAWLFWKGARE